MKKGKIKFVVTATSNMIQCTQKFTNQEGVNRFCKQIKALHDNLLKHHGYDRKVKPTEFYSESFWDTNSRILTKDAKKMSKRRRVLPILEKNEQALEKAGKLKIKIEKVNV